MIEPNAYIKDRVKETRCNLEISLFQSPMIMQDQEVEAIMQHQEVLLRRSHARAECVYKERVKNDEVYPGELFISAPYDHSGTRSRS